MTASDLEHTGSIRVTVYYATQIKTAIRRPYNKSVPETKVDLPKKLLKGKELKHTITSVLVSGETAATDVFRYVDLVKLDAGKTKSLARTHAHPNPRPYWRVL